VVSLRSRRDQRTYPVGDDLGASGADMAPVIEDLALGGIEHIACVDHVVCPRSRVRHDRRSHQRRELRDNRLVAIADGQLGGCEPLARREDVGLQDENRSDRVCPRDQLNVSDVCEVLSGDRSRDLFRTLRLAYGLGTDHEPRPLGEPH